jgi:hypothetical protein
MRLVLALGGELLHVYTGRDVSGSSQVSVSGAIVSVAMHIALSPRTAGADARSIPAYPSRYQEG